MDIENVFRAASRTIFDVLNEAGGCQIPAYQRPYSWDASNVHRLLEDATLGLGNLGEDADAVRFLGSIIAINEPAPRPAGWPRVLLSIIDGQQRLCTILVLNIIIHSKLRSLVRSLEDSESAVVDTIREEATSFLDELSKTYEFEYRREGSVYRFYPRIIRAIDDNWSRDEAQARYVSPIAHLIWSYIAHTHGPAPEADFQYRAREGGAEAARGRKALASVMQLLTTALTQLADGAHPVFAMPAVEDLRASENYVRELWQEEAPEGFQQFIEDSDDDDDELLAVQRIIRLTALARFVNFRMAVTMVEATAEDYAFDMFEALNTTGQPLTAFETFKPKVVEDEGADYVGSPSRRSIKKIEAYLDRFDKADERQAATSTLLIPFALAENGHKLEKHLSYQRRYLRDRYRDAGTRPRKRKFVKNMASVASFVGSAWRPENKDPVLLPDWEQRDDVAEFCFEALRKINHEVTLAPVSRFYAAFTDAGDDAKAAAAQQYFDAIKAVTAFSMIWRAAFGGTANIDNMYRDIMATAVGGAPPLCRQPARGAAAVPTLANLRTALLAKLAGARIDRASWVRDASQAAIYKAGQGITRFFLLAAAHDTVPDPAHPGLLLPGRRGSLPLLSRSKWRDATLNSVEHVAPDARHSDGWPEDLYEDQRIVQQLGNFILMPELENSILSNRPWRQKRILYSIFGAQTVAEANTAIAAGRRVGFETSETVRQLVANSSYLPMCASLKAFRGVWDADYVATRSAHLAGLAWDRVYPWLSPPAGAAARPRRRRAPG